MSTNVVAVFGPTGYTGRQVLGELRRRGITPLLVGRDRRRLHAVAEGDEVRVAGLDDGDALRRCFNGARAVINCVGPFALSARVVASAAIASGAHYLDITAEQAPVLVLVEGMDDPARQTEIAVVPAVGFYGGLGDLLASLTANGLARPVEVTLADAVRNWLLTEGSRATAGISAGRRWARRGGQLELITGEPRYGSFPYPHPLGVQPVMEDYPLPEAVTVSRHLDAPTVRLAMAASTLREVFGPDTPSPAEVTDHDRAESRFMVVAVVTDGEREQRTVVAGRDIYGVTAPMVVAATQALVSKPKSGVVTRSQVAQPADLLAGLQETGWLAVECNSTQEVGR